MTASVTPVSPARFTCEWSHDRLQHPPNPGGPHITSTSRPNHRTRAVLSEALPSSPGLQLMQYRKGQPPCFLSGVMADRFPLQSVITL